jgi:hypothetical protein
MVEEYLQGRRKVYVKPLQFRLLMLTAYFVINSVLEVEIVEITNTMWNEAGADITNQKSTRDQVLNNLFTTNLKVATTLFIPITGIVLKLLYRGYKYNLFEMIVFALYIYGCSYLFYSVLSIFISLSIFPVFQLNIFYMSLLITQMYIIYAVYKFFGQKGWLSLLKAIGSFY